MFIRKSRLGEKTSVRKIYGKLQSYIHDIYWEIVSKYGMLSDVKKNKFITVVDASVILIYNLE